MNAPDLFELHQQIAHWSYAQAQAHPLEASTWMQAPYWIEWTLLQVPGVIVGWWCHRFMRGERADRRTHERNGKRYEQHASGSWLQHWHDPETGKLARLEVLDDAPIGTGPAPAVNLTSKRQKLV